MIVKKKCQISVEFIIFAGIALLITVIAVSLALGQIKSLNNQEEFLIARSIALQIKDEVQLTADVEDGFSRDFAIPANINNHDYNVSISNHTLTVFTNTTSFSTRILDVTGIVNKGSNTISKSNGRIYIN